MEPCPGSIEEKKYKCPKIIGEAESSSKKRKPCCVDDEPSVRIKKPVTYGSLTSKSRDVFTKGYHIGLIKLDCKTKTGTGVSFGAGGEAQLESGKIKGQLECNYKTADGGWSFTEKWTTENALGFEICGQDHLLKGLKLCGGLTLFPADQALTGVVKAEFINDLFALTAETNYEKEGLGVGGSIVVKIQNWLVGYQGMFDTSNNSLKKNNIALGFSTDDFIFVTHLDHETSKNEDGSAGDVQQSLCADFYQKISPRIDYGIQLNWVTNDNSTALALGARYHLDQFACLRAKVDTKGKIGLGYTQMLREGITLSLSSQIDAGDIKTAQHSVGMALEFEA